MDIVGSQVESQNGSQMDSQIRETEKDKLNKTMELETLLGKSALIRKINDAILFQPTSLEKDEDELNSDFDESEFIV